MTASIPSLPELQKKNLRNLSTGPLAESFGQRPRTLDNIALQHPRPIALQFLYHLLNDVGMIVAGVMNTISRKKVEDSPSLDRLKFCTSAPRVVEVHLEQIDEFCPLRIDMTGIRFLSVIRVRANWLV